MGDDQMKKNWYVFTEHLGTAQGELRALDTWGPFSYDVALGISEKLDADRKYVVHSDGSPVQMP